MSSAPHIVIALGLILAMSDCPGSECQHTTWSHPVTLGPHADREISAVCSTCGHYTATVNWTVLDQNAPPDGEVFIKVRANCGKLGGFRTYTERAYALSTRTWSTEQGAKDVCDAVVSWHLTIENRSNLDVEFQISDRCPRESVSGLAPSIGR
jgi:hypothetical protein